MDHPRLPSSPIPGPKEPQHSDVPDNAIECCTLPPNRLAADMSLARRRIALLVEDPVAVSQRRAAEREAAEELHFLQMLPVEMWSLIIDWIGKDLKSLESLSNSSPFFRNILIRRRVDFLGQEALKIMGLNRYLVTRTWKAPTLPLACDQRKVCKSWCAGVDASFELHPSNMVELCSKFGKSYDSVHLPQTHRLDSRTAQLFVRRFANSHAHTDRNPFLGRKILVSTILGAVHVVQLLNLYGHHVWCLKISDVEFLDTRNLRRYLSALPNLRRLEFYAWSEFAVNARVRRLPVLPNLTTFRAKLEVAIQSGIVNSNPSIITLILGIRTYTDLRPVLFPHIKHLQLILFTKLLPLSIHTPALSKLTVHWRDSSIDFLRITRRDRFLRWQRLFGFINRNWGRLEQLKEVELELPGFESFICICRNLEQGPFYRLKLEKVDKLWLLMHSPCSVDFLLPMRKSLQMLCVRLQYFSDKIDRSIGIGKSLQMAKNCQTVQFLGFEKRLLESNIWFKFPKLQKVIIEGHLGYAEQAYGNGSGKMGSRSEVRTYTRREWERFL